MRTFKNEHHEIEYLRKQNKALKRTIGDLRKELKVDIKAERQRCYKEGYEACDNQWKHSLNKLNPDKDLHAGFGHG